MDMQGHLDGGCKHCAAMLHVWQGVVALAVGEQAFTPPSDVARIVTTQLAPIAANPGLRLLFDSSLAPAAAGFRGSVAARQFLFETDEYFIDLRLEPRRQAERASLIGQILNRGGKERTPQGLTVRLQDGLVAVAQTSTNQLGEFQFEFEGTNRLSIAISRTQEREIVLPLYGVGIKPEGHRGGK